MFEEYQAQVWNGQELLADIHGLSIDAAREIARTAPMTGHTGRIMCSTRDYTEVYPPHGKVRRGAFAETTLVHIAADDRP